MTPVAAVLSELYKQDSSIEARFVCDRAFEVQARGIMASLPFKVDISIIPAGKFRRYSHLTFWQHLTVPSVVFGNLRDITRIIRGGLVSLWLLVRHRPDVVFAKGGYVCLPMGLAAWLLHIPLVIHDSDTRPGLTNRVLARFARRIATGSPLENYPYDKRKTRYTGVPISPEFAPVSASDQATLKTKLGLPSDKLLVVATGGGLGSRVINEAVVAAAVEMGDQASFYVVTGKGNLDIAEEKTGDSSNIQLTEFVYKGMSEVLGAADIVVARGSATFLQELAGLEKAVVVVPAHQLGDQLKNAELFASHGAAIVLSDDELLDKLPATLNQLASDEVARKGYASRLHEFARPDAASEVSQIIVEAAK